MTDVRKGYASLRPLRIRSLEVARAERVAVTGLDLAAAELMVNLVTGASLPDEGQIAVFGRSTADIVNGDEWLASLDRFGIISDRAVFLEGGTVAQNLALPFTLEIDPISPATREVVLRLAAECDIAPEWMEQPGVQSPPGIKARVHLARAVALGPDLLLIEHPTAALPEGDRRLYGSIVARVCETRALAALVMTTDADFAAAAAHRTLTLQPATGELVAGRRRSWFH
jgi:ABC-type methionine transport system ATPase subunit